MSKTYPLVVSFPRSGVNWFCRAFETITGRRSPGQRRGISTRKTAVFRRTHATRNKRLRLLVNNGRLDKVLLLLRDPAVSFMRQNDTFPFDVYIENILFYDWAPVPKRIVHFDELFQEETIYDTVRWMGFKYTPFADFAASLEMSKAWYARKKHPNYKRTAPSQEDAALAFEQCRQGLGDDLYRKYLARYCA